MLFASIVLERIPLVWANLLDGLTMWVQNAGAIAIVGIVLVLVARRLHRDLNDFTFWDFPARFQAILPALKACLLIACAGYTAMVLIWVGSRLGVPGLRDRFLPREHPMLPVTLGDWILTVSGAFALMVVLAPVAVDLLTRIGFGRIWAVALLSWKEAVRGRVIWVFGFIALIFLFAGWFLSYKPEDQLRSYVRVVYMSMTLLCLILAGLLGSFSIPNDIQSNSIHTIVTKPVEKFEIVLGRFLGYGALLTAGLLVVSSMSLVYLLRGVNEEAAFESDKARVTQYGFLHFVGTKSAREGENVGREWSYRSYITGPTKQRRQATRQYAIWDFLEIPSQVTERTTGVVFEYSFDIFRLSKGEEDKGVNCSFTLVNPKKLSSMDPGQQARELDGRLDEFRKIREKYRSAKAKVLLQTAAAVATKKQGKSEEEKKKLDDEYDALEKKEYTQIEVKLIEQFHLYQIGPQLVTDFHTQRITIPADELRALVADGGGVEPDGSLIPVLRIFVSADEADQAQMVGVAAQDLYLVVSEKPFWQNYFKGVIGLWCTHMLVLGVAVACSTYFSGVISLLLTLFYYVAGMNRQYLMQIAEGHVDGGGPGQSFIRLATRMSPAAPVEGSPTASLANVMDRFFSWWIGRILNLIPDVGRHDLYQFVANGFDIGWSDWLLLDNGLALVGYLFPWAILAYYLMKYREIANPQ
ncbi:MAG: hypothetical protein HYR84_15110 [Planctomycetes bacterium]|nr:hypothetical protein [Planctomycetota bacterium]